MWDIIPYRPSHDQQTEPGYSCTVLYERVNLLEVVASTRARHRGLENECWSQQPCHHRGASVERTLSNSQFVVRAFQHVTFKSFRLTQVRSVHNCLISTTFSLKDKESAVSAVEHGTTVAATTTPQCCRLSMPGGTHGSGAKESLLTTKFPSPWSLTSVKGGCLELVPVTFVAVETS
jgi:hypothetical protein